MKKSVKKIIALLLAIMMVASVFVACSQTQEKSDESKVIEQNDKQEEQKEEPKAEEPKPEKPKIDLGGRVINYEAYFHEISPNPNTVTGLKWHNKVAELEEKYNFKLEYIIGDEGTEAIKTSVMAGDPMYDIAYVRADNFFPLLNDNVLQPISDLKAFDMNEPKWEPFLKELTTKDGKTYGMNVGKIQPRGGMYYNKRMFEEAGLPDPIDQMQKGEWTWDAFLKAAKDLTKDTDGDGVIDQWGVAAPPGDATHGFIYSNGTKLIAGEGKEAKLNFQDQKVVEALQFYYDCVNVHKVIMTPNARVEEGWDWFNKEFYNSRAAMIIYDYWPAKEFIKKMEDDYAFIMFPKGPNATDYVSQLSFSTIPVMPKGIKDMEEVAFVWDELTDIYNDEGDDWKETYLVEHKDPRSVNVTIEMIYDGRTVFNPIGIYKAGDEFKSMAEMLWKNEKTVEAAMQEKQPLIEAKLVEYINGLK